jgi:hypothetical protein
MRSALLIASLALAFTTSEKMFSQQTPQSSQQEAEAVVIRLYQHVVSRKPLGIPLGKDRKAIWPLLSRNLIERMTVAEECEKDYFRHYPDPNLKPEFGWLESGLFSGANEQADPSRFEVRRIVKQADGSYQVNVKLTYWPDFDKYRSPRGPRYDWNWEVIVSVIPDGGHFAVNEVLYSQVHPEDAELRLSQLLSHGFDNGKWVGYSE